MQAQALDIPQILYMQVAAQRGHCCSRAAGTRKVATNKHSSNPRHTQQHVATCKSTRNTHKAHLLQLLVQLLISYHLVSKHITMLSNLKLTPSPVLPSKESQTFTASMRNGTHLLCGSMTTTQIWVPQSWLQIMAMHALHPVLEQRQRQAKTTTAHRRMCLLCLCLCL